MSKKDSSAEKISKSITDIQKQLIVTWMLSDGSPSKAVEDLITHLISFDIDQSFWQEIISGLNDSDLAAHVTSRVVDGDPVNYQNPELPQNSSIDQQLKWCWLEIKRTGKSPEAICEENDFSIGLIAILKSALIEEELLSHAINLQVRLELSPDDESQLKAEFRLAYDYYDNDEKWALIPLFFNEQLSKQQIPILSSQATERYLPIFLNQLEWDGFDLEALKRQYVDSGYANFIPCLHHCRNVGQTKRSSWNKQERSKNSVNIEFPKTVVSTTNTVTEQLHHRQNVPQTTIKSIQNIETAKTPASSSDIPELIQPIFSNLTRLVIWFAIGFVGFQLVSPIIEKVMEHRSGSKVEAAESSSLVAGNTNPEAQKQTSLFILEPSYHLWTVDEAEQSIGEIFSDLSNNISIDVRYFPAEKTLLISDFSGSWIKNKSPSILRIRAYKSDGDPSLKAKKIFDATHATLARTFADSTDKYWIIDLSKDSFDGAFRLADYLDITLSPSGATLRLSLQGTNAGFESLVK